MPPVESSSVQITINVVDANSGEVIAGLERSFSQLGAAGSGAGRGIGQGMKEAGTHSLSALDNVRLLRDDLGIRIPRAMEKVIANSKMAMGAIGMMGTALVSIGAAGVLFNLGKEIYDLYEHWLDVGAAARDYQKEVEKQKDQDFTNTHSI